MCCRAQTTGVVLRHIVGVGTSQKQNSLARERSETSRRWSISSLRPCAFIPHFKRWPSAFHPTSRSIASTLMKTGARASASCAAKELISHKKAQKIFSHKKAQKVQMICPEAGGSK